MRQKTMFECQYCGDAHYAPMIRDTLWRQIAKEPGGLVCTSCMEKKLGRPLRAADLKDVPMNDGAKFFLKRLESRDA